MLKTTRTSKITSIAEGRKGSDSAVKRGGWALQQHTQVRLRCTKFSVPQISPARSILLFHSQIGLKGRRSSKQSKKSQGSIKKWWPHATRRDGGKSTETTGGMAGTLSYHWWKVMETKEGPQWLKNGKYLTCFQKEKLWRWPQILDAVGSLLELFRGLPRATLLPSSLLCMLQNSLGCTDP